MIINQVDPYQYVPCNAPGSYVNAIVTVEWCGRTVLSTLLTPVRGEGDDYTVLA